LAEEFGIKIGRKHSGNTAEAVEFSIDEHFFDDAAVFNGLDLSDILESAVWVELEELERTGEWRPLDQWLVCLADLLGGCVTGKVVDLTPSWVGLFRLANSERLFKPIERRLRSNL
jgi:hypothetical protein